MQHTNSWGGRHKEQLEYLVSVVKAKLFDPNQPHDEQRNCIRPLRVLEIGVGGVPLSYKDRCATQPARSVLASAARKFSSEPSWTYEPAEFADHFHEFDLELTILEIHPGLAEAVHNSIKSAKHAPRSYEVLPIDIQKPLPALFASRRFDLTFAGVLFPYLEEKQTAFENMTLLTDETGLLSVTKANEDDFKLLKKMYRRMVGRLGEDYVDVIDLAGRSKYSKIQGKFPVYQREEKRNEIRR